MSDSIPDLTDIQINRALDADPLPAENTEIEEEVEQDTEFTIPETTETYTSLKQASSLTGIPIDIFRVAKSKGCPGFPANGRIEGAKVFPWLKENLAAVQEDMHKGREFWRTEKLQWDSKRAKLAYEVELGQYLKREEVAADIRQIAQAAQALLKQRLEVELPVKLAGLDVHTIRERLAEVVDTVCATFQQPFDTWLTPPAPPPAAPDQQPEQPPQA